MIGKVVVTPLPVVTSPGDAARAARKILSLNVDRLMTAKGYANVAELAKYSTVGATTLYELLNETRGATLDTIAKLAWVFGVSVSKLLEAPKRRPEDA